MRSLVFLVLALAAVPLSANARLIDFPDVRKIVSFSSPQLSPDGKYVAYVRTRADFEADRHQSDLMLLEVSSRHARHLTYDRRGINSPRWSPDGRGLAFLALAQTGKEQQEQLFVLPMNGGEAQKITDAREGVDRFAWSPDGTKIAFVTQDEASDKKAIEAHHDAFRVGNNDYLQTAAATPSHLWLVRSGGGKAQRLTRGAFSLSSVEPDAGSALSWSANGRYIAFTRLPDAIYGDSLAGVPYAYDLHARRLLALTSYAGLAFDPHFAPRGLRVAYSRPTHGDQTNGVGVMVTTLGGGNGSDVRTNLDRNINQALWLPDAGGLLLAGDNRTQRTLWVQRFGVPARKQELGSLDVSGLGSFSRTGALVFTGSKTGHPSEIYLVSSLNAKPVALTNENGFIDRLSLARAQTVTWRSTKGFVPDGVLLTPPGFSRYRKYPLVLLVHGGPQSASTLGWSSLAQLIAAHGYLVFEPNYRGSTNLGDRFQHGIYRDAGQGPGEDVMSGVALLERMGIVDSSRIAVTGWSYGGYMTSWLEGHYHLWKAAVAGAALNDWFDDYNVSFYVNTDVPWFGASPWNQKFANMWREQSPITYADQIRTPTLIMGDVGDPNVTITNSYKMYHALKDNNVPVEFIAIPVHGHFPSDPIRGEDVNRRWLSWLDKYLK